MACNVSCGASLTEYVLNVCGGENMRAGGISRLVFITCDAALPADPCSPAGQAALVALAKAGKLKATAGIAGSQPKASYDKKRLIACRSEQVTGGTVTIEFMDYNNSRSNSLHDFYEDVMVNAIKYKVGWEGCDGTFTGFYDYTMEVSDVRDDNFKGTARFEGTISIDVGGSNLILKPRNDYSKVIEVATLYQNFDAASQSVVDDVLIDCSQIIPNLPLASKAHNIVVPVGVATPLAITANFIRYNNTETVLVELIGLPTGWTASAPVSVVDPTATAAMTATVPIGAAAGTYFFTVRFSTPNGNGADSVVVVTIV